MMLAKEYRKINLIIFVDKTVSGRLFPFLKQRAKPFGIELRLEISNFNEKDFWNVNTISK